MNVLISTLGKVPAHMSGGRYQKTTYTFSDKAEVSSQLFGTALFQWQQKTNFPVDRFVLLGTSTSMWDSLLELDEIEDQLNEADLLLYEEIGKAIRTEKGISSNLLNKLSMLLSEKMETDFSCVLIPFGKNTQEQTEILQVIANEVPSGSNVVFDFTHGLRHLPFFSLLSVFHLKMCNNSIVKNIYYGAFELKENNKTPVISMKYALDVMDWIEALSISETQGNYKRISEMEGVSPEFSKNLADLSFLRNTNQVGNMRKYAKQCITDLKEQPEKVLPKVGMLYQNKLLDMLSWSQENSFALRQLAVARQALEKSNYAVFSVFDFQ